MRRSLLIAVCAAIAAGCGDMRPTAPGRTGTNSGGTGVLTTKPNSALVGTWSFSRFFYDDAGNLHLSQTVWTFGSGGDATRTVYADNITVGVGDVIVTTGTWTATSTEVEVRFQGSTTSTRYPYHFDGGALVLAGTAFIRLQ